MTHVDDISTTQTPRSKNNKRGSESTEEEIPKKKQQQTFSGDMDGNSSQTVDLSMISDKHQSLPVICKLLSEFMNTNVLIDVPSNYTVSKLLETASNRFGDNTDLIVSDVRLKKELEVEGQVPLWATCEKESDTMLSMGGWIDVTNEGEDEEEDEEQGPSEKYGSK
eukprot:TRINITY_DN25210_c0_g1_i1.p2 TRINITY_DN25210_c0_g1~~TRINITY_DN25210_c0_g1_i1.p2  ORF type:complete len:166 (-),score=44.89 TRINITY_DN25210_c0_g1_i1:702-1199(-)